MQVHWGACFSDRVGVSNGEQGSILSPILFAVYSDGLLEELIACGIGGVHLLVHFLMLILFYWFPAHQQ